MRLQTLIRIISAFFLLLLLFRAQESPNDDNIKNNYTDSEFPLLWFEASTSQASIQVKSVSNSEFHVNTDFISTN